MEVSSLICTNVRRSRRRELAGE